MPTDRLVLLDALLEHSEAEHEGHDLTARLIARVRKMINPGIKIDSGIAEVLLDDFNLYHMYPPGRQWLSADSERAHAMAMWLNSVKR